MKVIILCGGQGTRAYPYTKRIPKALMAVSGTPIVEQVMRIYAAKGFDEFILSGGHMLEQIADHFSGSSQWSVQCVDTGAGAGTAERIRGCLDIAGKRFFATYCDGLGDIDLHELLSRHAERGYGATMTVYPLRSQYGIVYANPEGRVSHFDEKPVLDEYWINAGFFVFDRDTYAQTTGDDLERDVLPAMASNGILYTYRHLGFWRSLDTYKDQQELDRLWKPFSERLSGPRVHATERD